MVDPVGLEGGRIGLVEVSARTMRQASVTGPGRGSNSSGMQVWPSYKDIIVSKPASFSMRKA